MAKQLRLTVKEQKFIAAYVERPNATRAAILAGCPEPSAHELGSRMLKRVEVKAEIQRRLDRIGSRYEVSKERIVAELAKLGFANMQDFTRITPEGEPVIDFSNVDRDQMAAVGEITSEVYMEGKGEDATPVKRTKFKLLEKKGALMDLARLMNYIPSEKVDLNAHVVTESRQLKIEDLEPEQREQLRNILLSTKRSSTVTDVEYEEAEDDGASE